MTCGPLRRFLRNGGPELLYYAVPPTGQQIRAEERLAGMEVIVTGDLPPSTKMGE